MLLRMKNDPAIKNLRNHSPEMVEELRSMLARGASASPDPRRRNFYEVDGGSRTYYIHLSPATGSVAFLAVWDNLPSEARAPAELREFAACVSAG